MPGRRGLRRVVRAPFGGRHYRALANSFRVYERPLDDLARYVLGRGSYPHTCRVRTPIGPAAITVHHADDMQTVNEIFCRLDYEAAPDISTVVDIGSNIGVSALYFLTRNRHCHCHLYEPDPRNIGKLEHNLAPFRGRYTLHEHAVSDVDGVVDFGLEPTGRYGGIGVESPETIQVVCRDVNAALAEVIESDGEIDVLKLDVEGLEERTIDAIRPDLLEHIRIAYLEVGDAVGDLHPDRFRQSRQGQVVRLERRSTPPDGRATAA